MTTILPKQVIIIRHAEKTGKKGDSGLSRRGRARAQALVEAFPAQFWVPEVIIAAANKPGSTRPVDTVRPLADSLRLPIEERWNTEDYAALAHAVRTTAAFADRHVLICWRTETLSELGRAFGAPAPRWPRTDYDTVWIIDFLPEPSFRTTHQAVELHQPYSSIGEPG